MSTPPQAPSAAPFGFKQAVRALNLTADLLEVLGADSFRAQAYRGAARSLEAQSAAQVSWESLREAHFQGVPKVGTALVSALQEADQTGRFGPLQEALAELPPSLLELLEVRGLGPKKVRALWLAGIDSLELLRQGLDSGAVAGIKGFGTKTAATLQGAVAFALSAKERMRLSSALDLSAQLIRLLHTAHLSFAPVLSGDAARGLETAGSAEVVLSLTAHTPAQVAAALPWPVTTNGPTLRGEHEGLRFALHAVAPEQRGAAEVWFASPPHYRAQLQAQAEQVGLALSEGGLVRGAELLITPTQSDFWAALRQAERPAEYREAEHDGLWPALPHASELIQVSDILGFIHTHSTYSDGAASLSDMARAAAQQGQGCYLGIADHSQAAHYAHGLTPERLRTQLREVAELRRAGLNILAGSEVDILEDGRLDFDDDLLADLDYVVASVHSHFGLSQAAQTERLVRAVSHPLITVLGHPTGRLLLRRAGYDLDLNAVLHACAAHATAVEINANPQRLDLDWRWALAWRGKVKFAINTDAHTTGGLSDIRYGVLTARKAGLTPSDIINTLSQGEFLAFIAEQRQARRSSSSRASAGGL